MVYMLA